MFKHKTFRKILTLIITLTLIILLILCIYYSNFKNNLKNRDTKENREKFLRDLSIDWKNYRKVPPHQVNRILIVTQARSGSTFLGDLLQQSWPTFLHYEPLINMRARNPRNERSTLDEAIYLLIKLFKCDFVNLTSNYLSPVFWKVPYFGWNKVMQLTVGLSKVAYFNHSLNQLVCERSSNIVMKTIRLGIDDFIVLNNNLTKTHDWPPIKAVFLVRDPRGIMSSRNRIQWCISSPNCTDIDQLCDQIDNDIKFIKLYNSWSSDRITLIRYEDLSLNVLNYTKRLYAKLNLRFTRPVQDWIKEHTNSADIFSNPHSTIRNSRKSVFSWTKRLDIDDVIDIQDACESVMNQLGYKLLNFDDNDNETKLESVALNDILSNDFVLNHLSP